MRRRTGSRKGIKIMIRKKRRRDYAGIGVDPGRGQTKNARMLIMVTYVGRLSEMRGHAISFFKEIYEVF